MAEYLSPGVYVEEVSFRSKSIEGVPTSTTGFAGLTRFGPVYSADGPTTCEPRLVTSFTEFERVYGGIEPLKIGGGRTNYLAHAARAFFLNGGQRLYVSRVFANNGTSTGVAKLDISVAPNASAAWRARWPGDAGNVWVETRVVRSKNIAYVVGGTTVQVNRAKAGAIVEIHPAGSGAIPKDNDPPDAGKLAEVVVDINGVQTFQTVNGGFVAPQTTDVIYLLEMQVRVTFGPERTDVYAELGARIEQNRYIGKILEPNNPEDEDAAVYLDFPDLTDPGIGIKLMLALTDPSVSKRLAGGDDGTEPPADGTRDSFGGLDADPDDADVKATGLAALGEIEDIAIVAVPDAAELATEDSSFTVHQALIAHCESLRYRIGVIDGPRNASINHIRDYRGKFDSKYAALYHPWIEILDPLVRPSSGAPPARLLLPPSGFVAGIYARSDIQRGVHKAPANEVVLGLTRFEININKGRQDVLNPEGINALRFFEGRGNRVWGARTVSSDPEWKYVNVRRLFNFLEHSIDKGSQWAVFEPNNERLWANMRRTIEDFLLGLWKDGALLGDKPEQAYFVRCDRTTMTQNDLDNGRLVVLIGVAPVKPAEFVIFRIGQWTGDAKN
jgi:Bacteriophage tail sheath protein